MFSALAPAFPGPGRRAPELECRVGTHPTIPALAFPGRRAPESLTSTVRSQPVSASEWRGDGNDEAVTAPFGGGDRLRADCAR